MPGSAAADPSPAPSTALGTGEGHLRYGICVPCSKRPPPVRDAFSEAFGVKNRLLRYGRYIRYRKPPSTVRNRHSATKKGSWGTRRGFQRRAKQPTPQTVDSLLGYATRFQGPRCMKTPYCRTGRIFSARNSPRSLCSLRPLPPFPSSR